MALEEECECEGGSDAAWMATFADLMSLLLTFFVLLLSFANMDVVRFKVVLGSVKDAFGVQFEHPGDKEAISTSIIEMSKQESSPNIKMIKDIMMLQKVRRFIKDSGLEGLMEAQLGERGVVIRIKGHVLFDSGEAELLKNASKTLEPIVKLIQSMENQLAIEGHTDDRPIRTTRFPSNWELSTARAVATMRYLVSQGLKPHRVNVAGYADMRPIEPNSTSEGRGRNRRVEFVFLRMPGAEPITKADIEIARKELDRMRKNKSLLDDPGKGNAKEERDADSDTEVPKAEDAKTADTEERSADSRPSIAPVLSPNIRKEDLSPR